MIGYIYSIINKETGDRYIGKTINNFILQTKYKTTFSTL